MPCFSAWRLGGPHYLRRRPYVPNVFRRLSNVECWLGRPIGVLDDGEGTHYFPRSELADRSVRESADNSIKIESIRFMILISRAVSHELVNDEDGKLGIRLMRERQGPRHCREQLIAEGAE